MRIDKAFLAIGCFLLISISDGAEHIKEWLNGYVEINSLITGPTYLKRKYRIIMWLHIIFFVVLFVLIILTLIGEY